MYKCDSFSSAIAKATEILNYGGLGHTSVLHTSDDLRISEFANASPTTRVLINSPSSQGAIGDIYNFRLKPTLSIGCGRWGSGSLTSEITPMSFLSVKTVAERRDRYLWMKVPPHVYFEQNCLPPALREEMHINQYKRVFVVSDRGCVDARIVGKVTAVLNTISTITAFEVFSNVEPDPSFSTVVLGAAEMKRFQPDCIVAVGGGSPMDAAKLMRLLYEQPSFTHDFSSLAARFMDINKRIFKLDSSKSRPSLICIPTTSGTGSEVTPFAVIFDNATRKKYALASYSFTPECAIVDADLATTQPRNLAINSGFDALSHAIESLVSVLASEFTKPLSLSAAQTILAPAGKGGLRDAVSVSLPLLQKHMAQKRVHHAATIAGTAFSNAFLGIAHSLAHTLASNFHLPHGLCCILVLPYVIRFNAACNPTKMTAFPNLHSPGAAAAYSQVYGGRGGEPEEAEGGSVDALIHNIQQLRRELGSPMSIRAATADSTTADFDRVVDDMSLAAFGIIYHAHNTYCCSLSSIIILHQTTSVRARIHDCPWLQNSRFFLVLLILHISIHLFLCTKVLLQNAWEGVDP